MQDGGDLQLEWFFTGLLPEVDGLTLFLYLGIPGVILLWFARQVKLAAERPLDSASAGEDRLATLFRVHPRAWSRVYRLANGVAQFLISQWFLFVWGFIPSLVAFVTLLFALRSNNRPQSETTRNTDSNRDAAFAANGDS